MAENIDAEPVDPADSADAMPPSFPPEKRAHTESEPNHRARPKRFGKFGSLVLEFATVMAVALLAAVVLKTYLFQAFEIPSESMEDTLIPGDRILVNKLADDADELHRGDVIVFVDPGGWLDHSLLEDAPAWKKFLVNVGETIGLLPQNSGDHLVKRIIGVEGDTISAVAGEPITINGEPIHETYLKPNVEPSNETFSVTVPEGHVWVMGDNRPRSKDSRYHQRHTGFGFVPIKNIEGRAWLMIYPLDRMSRIDHADDVFAKVPEPVSEKAGAGTDAKDR